MTSSRSPSSQWTGEHGHKIAHRNWLTAKWHAINLSRKRAPRGPWEPYPCRWGQWYQDGRTAKKHWHVGRRKQEK